MILWDLTPCRLLDWYQFQLKHPCLLPVYQTTQRNIPEDRNINTYLNEKRKCHVISV
jgi:hypothetical protein